MISMDRHEYKRQEMEIAITKSRRNCISALNAEIKLRLFEM